MARTLSATMAAIDEKDLQGFLDGLSPDVAFTFGNAPTIHGHDAVRGALEGFWASIAGLEHHVQDQWEPEADTTVINLLVDYHRHDGATVTVPCVDVLRWDGDLVSDWRIVIDIAPVYAETTVDLTAADAPAPAAAGA